MKNLMLTGIILGLGAGITSCSGGSANEDFSKLSYKQMVNKLGAPFKTDGNLKSVILSYTLPPYAGLIVRQCGSGAPIPEGRSSGS